MYEFEIIQWGGIVNSVAIGTKEKRGYEKMGQILSKDSQRTCERFVHKRLQALPLGNKDDPGTNMMNGFGRVTMPYHEEDGR